jgi:hypothetical protein
MHDVLAQWVAKAVLKNLLCPWSTYLTLYRPMHFCSIMDYGDVEYLALYM